MDGNGKSGRVSRLFFRFFHLHDTHTRLRGGNISGAKRWRFGNVWMLGNLSTGSAV